jgi:hypothetical protein
MTEQAARHFDPRVLQAFLSSALVTSAPDA